MNRRVRAPFVTTVASVVIAGAALTGACNPPGSEGECPATAPNHGDGCDDDRSVCSYDNTGCSGTWTKASCVDGKWSVKQEGSTCNPPFPREDTGAVETSTETGACPSAEPAIGSSCAAAATCSYENLCPQTSGLKTNVYRCIGTKWSFENTLEAPIECPKTEPKNDEACGCAMYLPSKCTYGGNDAVCDGATQKWIVKAPTPTDAGADASSDAPVSSDAASDAPSD